jgi:chromosome segregation protein
LNFEKVELYGFKSFADKAEIKFDNGITAIVGPNGCGKSNVADAIRWVLGEQSAKTLRGQSMQDVIFSGTQNRKSLSYCEVSLYFDNSTKMFSLDYNEIIITRKLYRSGESEYFINKQPARLKDIVDLLHECGIGKEGYTIIGQGKVEEIMSAKPEVRRLIFEEATGIAKFKSRKNESERKLERTHENLIRYCDILAEIENQLGPLEKQAEKAREFNRLSEELKLHELNTYICKVDGVGKAKEKISTKIKGLDEELSLRNSELNKIQTEYDKVFRDINLADERLKKFNEELMEKRVGMEKSTGAKRLFEEKIVYLLGQIERQNKEIEDSQSLIKTSNETIKLNKDEIEKNNIEIKALIKKSKDLTDRIFSLSGKILLGEELADKNRRKVIESIESLSDVKLSRGALSIEKDNLTEKLKEFSDRLDALSVKREEQFNVKEKCDGIITELDRTIYEHKNQISSKEDEVRALNEEVAGVDNKIYILNSTITSLVTKDNFYKGLKESYEGYAPSVKLLMSKTKDDLGVKSRIKGVVAEIIKSERRYDIALETALGAAAQNVVTKNPDDAKYLIEYLKANRLGRVTFLPITSIKPRSQSIEITSALREKGALGVADKIVSYDPEFYNVISNLLGNTLVVDNIENATNIAKKYHFAFKIVTLDGDVFTPQGAMTGGSRKTNTEGLLSGERKIEENAELLAVKRAEMDKLKKQKSVLEEKRDKALDELSVLNDVYNEKRQQVVLEREKLTVCENNLSELGKEIERVNEMIDALKERLSKLSKDVESATTGVKTMEESREKARDDESKHQAEYDALRKERDELTAKNTEIQVALSNLRARTEAIEADNLRLSGVVSTTKETIEALKSSISGANAMIEELRLEQEKVALTKEEKAVVDKLRTDIENIESYKVDLREKLVKLQNEKEGVIERINVLTESKHAEEIALTKIDSDLEYFGQTILENYQETYETALRVRIEGYDAENGEKEIASLRRKRSSLGAINATAIDDYAVLKERYTEMTTQKEDLEKAERDLREAIDKIKAEMLAQFDDGFNRINENFQKIFKELFGGGRAMLQMDYANVEDRLEAGVEIVAEPPGKKLQNLSLLSGGEKALTAIAILFSIIKMRPMPFCVLDEIEAALDEANVDRFAKYLRKFSEETQFIVITHKKNTMEMADRLFGVTMQEKGVSKMVSVKLSDVAEFTGEDLG